MSEQNKNTINFRVANLSSYQTPITKEEYNEDYVSFGDNNDYFDRLIDGFMSSATNARCVNGISDMIYGRGLESLNSVNFLKTTLDLRNY